MVSVAPSGAVVGRVVELRRLGQLIEASRAGTAAFVMIEGEPGIGKSALLDEARKLAARAGFDVWHAQGEELERERPFGLVADALRSRSTAPELEEVSLAEALVARREPEGADLRFQLIESVCDLVEKRAETKPVALFADDVHWADPSSLLALNRLSRRVAYLPFVLVITRRPLPITPELSRLLDVLIEHGGLRVTLPPLSHDETVKLAARIAGAAIGPTLERELAATGGNPLFAQELVRTMLETGVLETGAGIVELTRRPEPSPSLRLTILRRMNCLPSDTLELLKLASVVGESFTLQELGHVSDRKPLDLVARVSDAIEAGFFSDLGGRLAFRHDLVREVLYLELSPAVRATLHRHVGRALAAAGAPTRQIAVHLSLGAEGSSSEAVSWLRKAAQEVEGYAPTVAIELLERALELAPPDAAAAPDLSAGLVRPLVWTGQLERAEAVARALLAQAPDPAVGGRLRLALAAVFFLQYRLPELEQLCAEALALDDLEPSERAHLLALAVMPAIAAGEFERALASAREAAHVGEGAASIFGVAIENTQGIVARMQGRFLEAPALGERAIRAARAAVAADGDLGLAPRQILANARVFQSWNLVAADRFPEAASSLRAAMEEFERIGAAAYVNLCHRGLANVAFVSGRWDDAEAELEMLCQLAEQTQVHGLDTHQPDPSLLLAVHQGRLRDARDALAAIARALPPDRWRRGNLWFAPLSAAVLEAEGDDSGALRVLEEHCREAHAIRAMPDYRLFGRALVRLALAAGRRDIAEAAAEGAAELSRRAGRLATTEGIALLARGLVDDDRDALIAAVDAYRAGPRPLDLAAACEEAADWDARHGGRGGAVLLLREALTIYDALGAAADTARTKSQLRDLGVRLGARGKRPRALTGWESLTAAEERVCHLVAEGLSNPEIGARLHISKRTVSTHLAHVFRKLDISSRSELAAIAARRTEAR